MQFDVNQTGDIDFDEFNALVQYCERAALLSWKSLSWKSLLKAIFVFALETFGWVRRTVHGTGEEEAKPPPQVLRLVSAVEALAAPSS